MPETDESVSPTPPTSPDLVDQPVALDAADPGEEARSQAADAYWDIQPPELKTEVPPLTVDPDQAPDGGSPWEAPAPETPAVASPWMAPVPETPATPGDSSPWGAPEPPVEPASDAGFGAPPVALSTPLVTPVDSPVTPSVPPVAPSVDAPAPLVDSPVTPSVPPVAPSTDFSSTPPAPASLDLDPSPWEPTPPSPEYLGFGSAPTPPPAPEVPAYGQPAAGSQEAGSTSWPTPPAGTSTPSYGQSMPAQDQATPSYGQAVPPYGQSPEAGYTDYQTYETPAAPTPPQPVYPASAGGYQMPAQPGYPVQQPYVYAQPGMMVPGQMIQTPYGLRQVGQKSKLAAGLLGIFLGSIGVGRFYRGFIGLGVLQIIVTFATLGVGALWGFIEGIVVLVAQPGSPSSLDSDGRIMS